jgi:hypothetical protein
MREYASESGSGTSLTAGCNSILRWYHSEDFKVGWHGHMTQTESPASRVVGLISEIPLTGTGKRAEFQSTLYFVRTVGALSPRSCGLVAERESGSLVREGGDRCSSRRYIVVPRS